LEINYRLHEIEENVAGKDIHTDINDEQRRFWTSHPEADEEACDIRENEGSEGIVVKIAFPKAHKVSTSIAYVHQRVTVQKFRPPS
jgi:hypothetical protein